MSDSLAFLGLVGFIGLLIWLVVRAKPAPRKTSPPAARPAPPVRSAPEPAPDPRFAPDELLPLPAEPTRIVRVTCFDTLSVYRYELEFHTLEPGERTWDCTLVVPRSWLSRPDLAERLSRAVRKVYVELRLEWSDVNYPYLLRARFDVLGRERAEPSAWAGLSCWIVDADGKVSKVGPDDVRP